MAWNDPGLIANALVAILLVAVIAHAAMLNRRLKTWRAEAADMEHVCASFVDAIARAERSLAGLKQAAREDGEKLDTAQKQAQSLRDDLSYLCERSGSLADRLEGSVRRALTLATVETPSAAVETAAPVDENAKTGGRVISDAERKLITALRTMR